MLQSLKNNFKIYQKDIYNKSYIILYDIGVLLYNYIYIYGRL